MFTTTHKKVIVSVINDLATDQRVQRSCSTLGECGYSVLLVGRRFKNSATVDHLPYQTRRMHLFFKTGPLFYFFFNVRLFFTLLFTKSDLLFANDLDTLLPNYLVSKLKGIPLIYDSHEIFCEVPELQKTPFKKRIWERLERSLIPKLNYCITVNQSIAGYFKNKYSTDFSVVRNIPMQTQSFKLRSKAQLNLPANKKILIFQGAGINIERGAEELVKAMAFIEGVQLLIIGSGDVFPKLKKLSTELNLTEKITIIDKLPKSELLHYTYNSDLGISIDKDSNLNYHFSLPNKIFDYLQAQLPILASRLPEIENLMNTYSLGDFIESHDPEHIAKKINETLNSALYPKWKENTLKAIAENNWEHEKLKLIDLINTIK